MVIIVIRANYEVIVGQSELRVGSSNSSHLFLFIKNFIFSSLITNRRKQKSKVFFF